MKYNSMDELWHFGRSKLDGAPNGSGRYPLGSGKNPRRAILAAGKSVTTPRKKHKQKEMEQRHEAAKPTYKSMSDDELRAAINRAQLEQQYVQNLITPYRKKTGKEKVAEFISKPVHDVVQDGLTRGGKALVAYGIKQIAGDEIYKAMYPKK